LAEATLLTRQELEILQLMQEGLSNKDVASTLYISMHTVKRHASNIYEKLKVNGRQEAIFRANEMGILE
jgi:LuxR family maltose regulon positive regulatory protein